MRKEYVYVGILSVCIAVVIWGIVSFININYNNAEAKKQENVQEVYENNTIVATIAQEKTVSPNSNFALKKYYDECSHFQYEESELPIELVNLTKKEVENYYSDWEVEEFTDDNLVLAKEINGYCNEHFLIRLDEENVNVYRFGTLGELTEYKKTDIARAYLPPEDIANLEEGITVYGEGKLSSALEDFE